MRPDQIPIRDARVQAGYRSAAEAARRVGMEPSHFVRLELGGRAPTWATMQRLIDGLDLGLEHFYRDDLILAAATRISENRKGKPS